jgi:bifunctional DNA-binding transcriptional regulator/antitoxin component of YhaV-PrlF toxin-antitoxin module
VGIAVSVTVSERKVDDKRRVTLPPTLDVKEGQSVVMIASRETAVVASDRRVAEKLTRVLRELETEKKVRAVEEWARLIEEAGLSGLKARDIDRVVTEGIPEEGKGVARKSSR